MSTDYQAQDEALDAEIRALYAQDTEEEQSSNSPEQDNESGTESEHNTSEQELSEESTQNKDDAAQESIVSQDRLELEKLQQRYDNSVVAMNKAQQELADRRKQDAERDNQLQSLHANNQALQQQLSELQQSTNESKSTQQHVDDDDLKEARELYPEVVDPLLNMIAKLEKKLAAVSDDVGGVRKEVGDVKGVADRYQETEREQADRNFWNAIQAKHADALELNTSPEFIDWFNTQSENVRNLGQSGNPKDALFLFDQYRAANPVHEVVNKSDDTLNSGKSDKLAAAKEAAGPTIKTAQRPETKMKFTNAQIANMSAAEYAKHEAAIDEALAKGEIA